MPNVLLITGGQGSGKTSAARVAAQIAEQHHGASVSVLEIEQGSSLPRHALKPAPGLGRKELVVVVKSRSNPARLQAHRVINLDRYARFPRGRAVTFAIREAVDACMAAS